MSFIDSVIITKRRENQIKFNLISKIKLISFVSFCFFSFFSSFFFTYTVIKIKSKVINKFLIKEMKYASLSSDPSFSLKKYKMNVESVYCSLEYLNLS